METVQSALTGAPFVVDFSAFVPSTQTIVQEPEMTEDEARNYFCDLLTRED